ncbi:uncharacterized protein E0L32_000057 [Thyridium curvatum]|uniref:Pentatricopeptide repeat protein n=1 Tax=Thyridium curvatum TaxID=1093900 RepID=A0A507B7R0_9PEZI|nr:uncharacterized protein E0L32_000057 [Thyridium curvatum]TPX15723.1 hypothetical protein E0L32_000057 [Thyridium curvatum]
MTTHSPNRSLPRLAAHHASQHSAASVHTLAERTGSAADNNYSKSSTSSDAPDERDDKPGLSPGSNLVARLADVPIRQHGRQSSVLVEPLLIYSHKAETHRSRMRHHQSLTRQARLEAIRQAQLKPLPDWRVILRNLTAWTPDATPPDGAKADVSPAEVYRRDAVKVVVPETAVAELLGGVDHNLWDIRKRTGCELKLYRCIEQDGSSALLLSGTDRAIARAVTELLRHTKGAAVTPSDGLALSNQDGKADSKSDKSTSAIISTEIDRKAEFEPYLLTRSANDIPKPAVWTKESFLGYVAALVKGQLAPELAAKVYPGGATHDDTVIALLHGVFNEEGTRSALSTSAFKMALAFMAQRGHRHRPDARALYVRMEMFGLPMDVETYNILLASTAKVRDLRNFDSTLRLMNGRGFAPDLTTWILFMRVMESEEVKRYIIHSMSSKGLLDAPAAVRLVAKEMVAFDIDRAVQQNMDVPAFLAEQESRYGPAWLSRDAGNKVLEVLGRYGRFDDCSAFLDVMARAGPAAGPDVVSFNTVLTHCKVQHKLGTAICTLRQMERLAAAAAQQPRRTAKKRKPLAPDATTYHLLFELAWRRRMVSLVGAIWRYASLARATSFRMRRRAAAALSSSSSPAATGRMITARAILDDEARADGESARLLAAAAAGGGGGAAKGNSSRKNKRGPSWSRLGAAASRYYAERYAGWEPAVPLGEVLAEALARDGDYLRAVKKAAAAAAAAEGEGADATAAAAATAALVREPMSIPLREVRGSDDGGENGGNGTEELTRRIYF